MELRVATYNIHKCQGLDRRTSAERIVAVIRELKAEVVCLQEVVNAPGGLKQWNQAEEIARAFPGWAWRFGGVRELYGGTYGNLTLSSIPVVRCRNHDISVEGRERRGVLETEIALGSRRCARIFNLHLGTGFMERRGQARQLLHEVLGESKADSPRVVIGDFNEWTRGLTTKLMTDSFASVTPKHALGHRRTFPGLFPVLTLDHCYYEAPLELLHTEVWLSRTALVASDHLPLVATFGLGQGEV